MTDNSAANDLAYNQEYHRCTKHVERSHFLVLEARHGEQYEFPCSLCVLLMQFRRFPYQAFAF